MLGPRARGVGSCDALPVGSPSTLLPATSPATRLCLLSPDPSNCPCWADISGLYCDEAWLKRGAPPGTAAAALRSALLLLSSASRRCSSSRCASCRLASRALRSLITSRGVLMPVGVPPDTGTGPPVLTPPLLARLVLPPPRSDIWAFSSTSSAVKGNGLRMASSRA